MSALHLTGDNFDQEVLKSDKPVLVDFFATWCGPCKAMAPVIDELAHETKGRFTVGKLDVDENNASASKYQVMSIPTIIFFKNGEAVERLVGVQPKEKLMQQLEALEK